MISENTTKLRDGFKCYVKQPSNWSDLFSSTSDPDKQLSSEACEKLNKGRCLNQTSGKIHNVLKYLHLYKFKKTHFLYIHPQDLKYFTVCINFGVVYNGTDINEDGNGVIMDTWQSCSSKCDANPDCTYWTWFRQQNGQLQGSCFLKQERGQAKIANWAVSGKKNCYLGPIPGM